jgi:hypothetical protein
MDNLPQEDFRINAIASRVVVILGSYFSYSEQESRRLFDKYHSSYSNTRGLSDADYYDHESAEGIALEVEFLHRFGDLSNRIKFINWRKDFYASRK